MMNFAQVAQYRRRQIELLEKYAKDIGFNHGAVLYMLCHKFGDGELTSGAIDQQLAEAKAEISETIDALPGIAALFAETGKSLDDLVCTAEAAMLGNYDRCAGLAIGGEGK